MQYIKLLLVCFLFIFITNVFSQSETLEVKKIILIDDSEFVGSIISENEEIIYFKTKAGVDIEIKKALVKEIQTVGTDSAKLKPTGGYQTG